MADPLVAAQRQRQQPLGGGLLVADPLMAAQRQRQQPLGRPVVLLGPLFGRPLVAADSNLLWRAQRGPRDHPEHRPRALTRTNSPTKKLLPTPLASMDPLDPLVSRESLEFLQPLQRSGAPPAKYPPAHLSYGACAERARAYRGGITLPYQCAISSPELLPMRCNKISGAAMNRNDAT